MIRHHATDLAREPSQPRLPVGAPASPDQHVGGPVAPAVFTSVLFDREEDAVAAAHACEPAIFHDLNLDQCLDAILAGYEQYELAPFFWSPLARVASVSYRHQVVRDLRRDEIVQPIGRFSDRMSLMREQLSQAAKLHHTAQRHAWFRDGVEIYCAAVVALADELAHAPITAQALDGLQHHLTTYVASEAFTTLVAETRQCRDALESVNYSVRSQGARVTVGRAGDDPDYRAAVEGTFERFRQGAVTSHLVALPDAADMNHIEAQIVDLVARLYPDVAHTLAGFFERHREYLDPTIGRFDREIQFYRSYLAFVDGIVGPSLPFCLPLVTSRATAVAVDESFDLALALKLAGDRGAVVCNGFSMQGSERIIVVTGPNNGGKTTFARMVGQVHYLAGLGVPVPGRTAQLQLPDEIFTHFEREEDIETRHGKLEDELVRVHAILERATARSLIVANESFSSTALRDALFLGTEVLNRITGIGALAVYVTFVDELASLNAATISMAGEIVPDNPAQRTFHVVRKPADGLASAAAIAAKYGLSYDQLRERVGR